MKTRLLFLLSIFISFSCLGQNEQSQLGTYEAKENLKTLGSNGQGVVRTFDNRYQGVKGTQFAFEEWFPGEVFTNKKEKVYFQKLNYNVFDNRVSYREPGIDNPFEIDHGLIDFFYIYGPDTLKFVRVTLPRATEESFAELIYQGNTILYRVYKKEFLKANYEGGYSADRKYDEFADKIQFFVLFPGSTEVIKLKTSKAMSKLFPDHNSEMKKELSKYSSKQLDTPEILRKVIDYYDSL